MKIEKSRRFEDSSNVAQDIEHARLRMIYENPTDYADWRLRMGLKKPVETSDNPAMRARVGRLFRELRGA